MRAEDIIPNQNSGVQTNTESSVELRDEKEAQAFYQKVRQRLLDVNHWHDLAGAATAKFRLTDKEGREVNRSTEKGDYFKIDIPGPGTATGEGHDWVRIEAMEDSSDEIVIHVRPATNPQNKRNDVAHFFSHEATTSFVVTREGRRITAAVYGRNEKPNMETEKWEDKLRNAAVATGAFSGFSKLQWRSLVNGLVKKVDS